MELGEKLLQARLEAGLSQRQLCGEEITRNMLSQIEHGKAKPSMKTLRILAERLGKPVSYFLEEDALLSANRERMEQARRAYLSGDCKGVRQALAGYQEPDEVFRWERELLDALAALELAREAVESGRFPYARELLEETERISYPVPGLERQRALLRRALGEPGTLPDIDLDLLLRARSALAAGDTVRCTHILEAMEDHSTGEWNLLRGSIFLEQGTCLSAVECFHRAETAFPEETARHLERCYRELGNYKQAYFYACKRKEQNPQEAKTVFGSPEYPG